ncbi:hypothetical protein [Mucilaginibacter sp. 10I4]|uniref:hypothetical protein n=1 Tax=Mucilaginibacter sp. 10I4 TaxID=3048580 RepID=UPI002B23BA26|nr:hypothetical protein [Mucilaginibacter sp. 10I4]MEB0262918.1 hypothetical protein [Mucilaginibacter sp. 10I4]
MSKQPAIKFNSGKIERLLKQIHSGEITETDLPVDLYDQIGEYFKNALYQGFGSGDFEAIELLSELRDNVYLFSAAKTYQFTKACSDLLVNEQGEIKPFSQFYSEGQEVYGQYNETWAQAEYNTVIGQSQMANQWQTIEANKEILPMLTFSTNGVPCPECLPFEGLTAHVDSPIWDVATPLLHFNCQCILIPSDDAAESTKEFIGDLPMDNIPDDFKNNPGKTGEIFTKEHPYFSGVPKGAAANNFGLEIPETD